LFPELKLEVGQPSYFPIPSKVVTWDTHFDHDAESFGNILMLCPYQQNPLLFYNPTSHTSLGDFSIKSSIVSPVVTNTAMYT